MIILESKRLVIVTPPHCASGNTNRALCSPGRRGYLVVGPTPGDPDTVDHHYAKVPAGFVSMGYRVALIVRHPLDRLIGLHKHVVYHARVEKRAEPPWGIADFDKFVRVVVDSQKRLTWFYHWTIDQLVGPLAPDVLVRFETLQQDLDMLLEGHVDMDGPYETAHDEWRTFYNPDTLALATEWARPDLERFEYVA